MIVLSEETLRRYPREVRCLWMTTPLEPLNTPDGYIDVLRASGYDSDTPMKQRDAVLTPVSDLNQVLGQREALLTEIRFSVYDALDTLEGGTAQTNNSIILSYQAGQEKPFAQSTFKRGLVAEWQPNFFRPEVFINGTELLRVARTNNPGSESEASIGLDLPSCFFIPGLVQAVDHIEVRARCIQIVDRVAGKKYRHYPIKAEASFRLTTP